MDAEEAIKGGKGRDSRAERNLLGKSNKICYNVIINTIRETCVGWLRGEGGMYV